MPLVNVASSLPMAVEMTNTPAPGHDPTLVYTIVGQRDPASSGIPGWGITYNVDQTVYDDWIATHADQRPFLKLVTTQDLSDMQAAAVDPDNYGYEQGLPPGNTMIPHLTQTGSTLNCTMGEWTGNPTTYHYAWSIDGVAAGADANSYDASANVGQTAICYVSADNAQGSGTAPPSNAVVVT